MGGKGVSSLHSFLEHYDHTGMYRLYAKIKIESRKSSIQMRWVAMHLHSNENARRNSSVTVSCCEYYSCVVSLVYPCMWSSVHIFNSLSLRGRPGGNMTGKGRS